MMTPTLNLDFTTATLDPRITFARSANTATRVNSSGFIESVLADTARFDFSPVSLACRGILVEQSRVNSALRSEEFQTLWIGTNASVTADQATSPANTLTADKLIPNTTAGVTHNIVQTINVTSGTYYTFSCYMKKAEYYVGYLGLTGGGNGFGADFIAVVADLNAGTVTTATGSGTAQPFSYGIQDAGNGWYRLWMTALASSTVGSLPRIYAVNGSSYADRTAAGDGTSGIYIWGAQFENGISPTSYIPTTTAAVTRNADVATITGTNFSDWWKASKGGVLVRARPGTVSGVRPWLQFDDGTSNEIIALRGNTTNPELYIVDGGVAQAQIDAGTIATNTDYSLTGWWQTNDCKARLDSNAVVADTTATIPTVTQARLGSDGTNYLNGHLASISYYDSFSEQIYTRRKNKAVFNLM